MDSKPLTQQKLFWASIRIPAISFIYFGFFSWVNYIPQFNVEGFERFINISKLPLALLSLSIPLIAVVNNIHRTIQTDEQINQTRAKNKVDAYYSHQKNIIEHFNHSIKRKAHLIKANAQILKGDIMDTDEIEISIASPFKLYKKIFNQSTIINNNYSISPIITTTLKETWDDINSCIEEIAMNVRDPDRFSIINKIETNMERIATILNLTPLPTKESYEYKYTSFDFCSKFHCEENLKRVLRAYAVLTHDLLDILDIRAFGKIIPEITYEYIFKDKVLFPAWSHWTYAVRDSAPSRFQRTEI